MHLGCVGHAIWFIGCHHFLDLHIVKDDSTMSMNETRLDLKDPGKVFRVKWWQSKKALIWVLRQTVIIHLWTYRAVLDYPNAHSNDSDFYVFHVYTFWPQAELAPRQMHTRKLSVKWILIKIKTVFDYSIFIMEKI